MQNGQEPWELSIWQAVCSNKGWALVPVRLTQIPGEETKKTNLLWDRTVILSLQLNKSVNDEQDEKNHHQKILFWGLLLSSFAERESCFLWFVKDCIMNSNSRTEWQLFPLFLDKMFPQEFMQFVLFACKKIILLRKSPLVRGERVCRPQCNFQRFFFVFFDTEFYQPKSEIRTTWRRTGQDRLEKPLVRVFVAIHLSRGTFWPQAKLPVQILYAYTPCLQKDVIVRGKLSFFLPRVV